MNQILTEVETWVTYDYIVQKSWRSTKPEPSGWKNIILEELLQCQQLHCMKPAILKNQSEMDVRRDVYQRLGELDRKVLMQPP